VILADTDVLIDFLAGKDPGRSAVATALADGNLQTTAISRFELLSGARTRAEHHRLRVFLDALPCIPLGPEESDRAAAIAVDLSSRGEGVDTADTLIAGIALVHGGGLLTRNTRHFARIPGLRFAPLRGEHRAGPGRALSR